jgi:hypothetical protein
MDNNLFYLYINNIGGDCNTNYNLCINCGSFELTTYVIINIAITTDIINVEIKQIIIHPTINLSLIDQDSFRFI